MLELTERIVAPEALLSEANRVLKRNGFLILSTPNFAFLLNRLRIIFGTLSSDEGYHYRFFTVESLEKQLHDAGFSVEQAAHTMPAFGANLIGNRLLGRPRVHVRVPGVAAPLLAQTPHRPSPQGRRPRYAARSGGSSRAERATGWRVTLGSLCGCRPSSGRSGRERRT